MSLANLRSQLARIRQSLPQIPAIDAGADSRNARWLATIAAEAEGPRRDCVVMMMVHTACGLEEPDDYKALVEAIGPESIERAFPAGIPTQQTCAFVRERARNYRPTGGTVNPLEVMIINAIKRRDHASVVSAEEAQS